MAKVLALLNILILPKNYSEQINEYLHSDEVSCKCNRGHCHFTLMAQSTVDSFYNSRVAYGQPLIVNSWFRCQEHNKAVGGIEESSHTTGFAVDIKKPLHDGDAIKLGRILKENFDVVIPYPTFWHCHNNADQVEGGICG